MTVPPPPGATPPPPPPPMPPGPGMPPIPLSSGSAQSNGLAVTSLVLGIISLVSFCVGFLAGIPAIIFGVLGRKKAAELNGEGSGQATGGLIMGIIGTVIGIGFVILFFTGAILADSTKTEFEKQIEESNREYDKIQEENDARNARTGDDASKGDYDITKVEVDVSDYGYVTYTAYIENTADFETGYRAKVKCEGNLGDVDTYDTYAYSLDPGDKKKITAYFTFDSETATVDCGVTEVLYDY